MLRVKGADEMKRAFQPNTYLEALASPQSWRFVCSALPIEERPVRDPAYARWAKSHLDRHSHREILFCLAGETFEHFAGRDYRCRPGSVFLFDAGDIHAQGYPQDGRSFVHLWIMVLADDVIATVYSQTGRQPVELRRAPLVLAKAERDLLDRCWRMVKHPPGWMPGALRRTTLFSAVFAIVLRAVDNWIAPPAADNAAQRRQAVVAAIQRHIETHLAEDEDLDALARVSGYSKFHFARMFKACTGQTVHGYVDGCRRTQAEALLRQGLRCKEVAVAIGFASPAAFSNWRRRQAGKSTFG